jgi:hypothetical protein
MFYSSPTLTIHQDKSVDFKFSVDDAFLGKIFIEYAKTEKLDI